MQENFNRQLYEIKKKYRYNDKLQSSDMADLKAGVFAPENRQRYIQTLKKSSRAEVLKYWNGMNEYQQDAVLFKLQKRTHTNLQKPADHSTQIQMGFHVINGNVSLGCRSFSKLMGCTSASMGHYWQQKLKAEGVLYVAPNQIKIWDGDLAHYMEREHKEGDPTAAGYYARQNNHPRQPFTNWDGYKVLPNILSPLIS